MSDFDYLSGLFDGEGCAGVYRIKSRNNRPTPIMTVQMTDPEPVDAFYQAFGGYMHTRPASPGRKAVHEWRVSHQKARYAALMLFPGLKNTTKMLQVGRILVHYGDILCK